MCDDFSRIIADVNMLSQMSASSAAALDLAALSQTQARGAYVGRDKSSEWPQFNGNSPRVPDRAASRNDRRVVTNPTIALSAGLGDLSGPKGTVSGHSTPLVQQLPQGVVQGLSSRRGSPLALPNGALSDGLSITTARSVPNTPLPGAGPNGILSKGLGTPLSAESPTVNGLLAAQGSSPVELHPSLSRMPSTGYENGGIGYSPLQAGMDDPLQVYDMNGSMDSARFSDYGYENGGRLPHASGGAGSTALYHHNGTKYGLGINGRQNGADGKMNGLHGPKHKRGDIDRECEFICAYVSAIA